jgi:signal transduction histidine kinase
MKLPEDSPAQGDLDQIHDVAQRASSLVRQLLAFSRQQILEQKVVDLNELIQQTEALLRRVIGEDMELVTSLTPQVGFVKVDPGPVRASAA